MARRAWLSLTVSLLVGSAFLPVSAQVPDIYLYVNDLASPGVLLMAEENSLDDLCFEIDDKTTAEVAILLVNTTLPDGIDQFAVQTFERNAIGKQGKDNGVLILVSVDERKSRIEVGYGLEGVLNDAKVGRFLADHLVPALEVGDYYDGLWELTFAVGTEILNNYDPGGGTGQTPRIWVLDWWMVLLLVILIALSIVTRGRLLMFLPNLWKRGGFGGGRSGGGGARRGF